MKKSIEDLVKLLSLRDETLLSGALVNASNDFFRIYKDEYFVYLNQTKWIKDVLNKEQIITLTVMRIPHNGNIRDNKAEIARVCDEMILKLTKGK